MLLILKIINKLNPRLTKYLIRFFRQRNKSNKVLFIIEFPESYQNFRSLIKEFSNPLKSKVEVLFYEGKYTNTNKSDFSSLEKFGNVNYISKITQWEYDKIFLHNPFDLERDEKYNFFNLFFCSNQIIYISYGVEIAGLRTQTQFNMPAQRYSDKVFVHSLSAKKQYEKYCKTGSKHISDLGHPFFENINVENEINIYDYMLCFHHSVDKAPFDLCTYNKFIESCLFFLKSNPNKRCLFRPHPMLKAKLEVTNETELFNELISLSNVTYDTNNNFFKSFESSRSLITDIGSFLMIFPFYKKPMLILANSSSHLGDDGEYFINNLCFDKSTLYDFLKNKETQDKMKINPEELFIKTNQISSNIYKSLCVE
tara:strand:- start:9371 stop:10477 length:1107 start_codon:yes stop_codon:yes gene_type:complete